jgi:hypothetical protein
VVSAVEECFHIHVFATIQRKGRGHRPFLTRLLRLRNLCVNLAADVRVSPVVVELLAMLAMQGVLAAPTAVLLQRKTLTSVALALHRHVVATFALVTRHCDGRSLIGWHFFVSSTQYQVLST